MKFISMKALSTAAAVATVSVIAVAVNPAQALKVSNGTTPTVGSGFSSIGFGSGFFGQFLPDPDPPNDLASDAPIVFNSGDLVNGSVKLSDTSPSNPTFLGISYSSNAALTNLLGNRPVGSTGRFLSVFKDNATFEFTQSQKYFGLLWGSIDSDSALDNVIEFFNAGVSVAKFNGNAIQAAAAAQGFTLGANANQRTRYVEFFKTDFTGSFFDKVVLTNAGDDNFFEVDNIAYQVPTPALLPGLIGLGVAALRKRKQQAKQEADA